MKNNWFKFIINILIILVVLGIVLYFSLKDDYDSIINSIVNMNKIWVFVAVFLTLSYRTLIGISNYNLVKINGEKISIFRSIQLSFIILFFHGVTPFAGGGQPMEIYYLHNEKIGITKAASITLQNFIVYQISLVLVSIFAVFYNYYFKIFPNDSLIKKFVIIGFLINLGVLVLTFVVSFGKRLNKFICNQGVSLLGKFRVIKDVDGVRNRLDDYLANFHKNAIKLSKHKGSVLFNILINILALVVLYSVPYAVSRAIGINNLMLVDVIVSTIYVMTIGSFIPIPGGTGGIEYGFVFFFSNLIKGSVLNAIMLVWRFITYYLGIIIGAVALALYRKKDKTCG